MGVLDIIGLLIGGLIVGGLARLLLPGDQELSWLRTIALGVAGMLIGGFIGGLLWDADATPFILGTITAVVLLFGLQQTGLLAKIDNNPNT
jgi:uncharacterized membrane protein YeaQ/YmgE (transglycosylase-associated protein family)